VEDRIDRLGRQAAAMIASYLAAERDLGRIAAEAAIRDFAVGWNVRAGFFVLGCELGGDPDGSRAERS
jgi:hypothetical protein